MRAERQLQVSSIAAEFSYLKMLGHVYVVEDAKDLAQIVRDVTRYGGAYKPEVCKRIDRVAACSWIHDRMCMSSSSGERIGRGSRRRWIKLCII